MSSPRKQAEIIRLYDQTSVELQRMLYRKLGNHHEAEEIAQDAYEKLCLLVDREDVEDLRKYFFTMANRLALNLLRRRGLERQYLTPDEHFESDGGATQRLELGPERVISAKEKLFQIKRALQRLPNKTRHVFLLHRFDGYSYPEIAGQLGLSKKAVEYHMKQALKAVVAATGGSE